MMERTLFGVTETKQEQRERAKTLAELYAATRDAPDAIACRKGQIDQLTYFIDKSNRRRLDPNDLDGLQRLIGETDELLTKADCASMRRNRKIWKPFPK